MSIVTIENQTLTGAFDSVAVPEKCQRVLLQSRGDLPIDVAPSLWLSARFPSTLGFRAGTNYVSSWADKSVNGWDAQQGTSENQPIYTDGILNGRPALFFDSSGKHFLTCGAHDIAGSHTALTVFGVVKVADVVSGGGAVVAKFRYDGGAETNGEYLFIAARTSASLRISEDGAWGVNITSSPAYAANTTTLVTGRWSTGVNHTVYRNGILMGTSASAITDTIAGSGNLLVGAWEMVDGTEFCFTRGYIGEVIAFPSALSDVNRRLVEKYLMYNWGI